MTTDRKTATPVEPIPLMTPEIIRTNPTVLQTVRPDYPLTVILPDDDLPTEDRDTTAVIWIGDKRPSDFVVSTYTVALALEGNRVGIRLTAAINKATIEADKEGEDATLYPVFRVPGAQKDNLWLRRLALVGGAIAHEAVKTADSARDLRAHNLYATGQGRPEKAARDLFIRHATRLAEGRDWPLAFTVAQYIDNLWGLFAAHDEEAGITPA